MATQGDMTGLVLFLVIACGFAGFILYAFLNNRRALNQRRKMIQTFREHPVISKNAAVLLHGPAQSPDLVLPTTGEHVAYYALIILSRESSLSSTDTYFSMGGSSMTDKYVTGLKGFRFFVTSGDFTVTSNGISYSIRISSLMSQFAKGASRVTSLVAGEVRSSGIPAETFDDMMSGGVAEGALAWAFGFSAPIKSDKTTTSNWSQQTTSAHSSVGTVKSTVDSRVQNYLSGTNLPRGILEILEKKGIKPEDKTEITVIELFIPVGREVYVFGTFDGDKSIIYTDPVVRLSVSYDDPGLT
jgi:hypothetical protein